MGEEGPLMRRRCSEVGRTDHHRFGAAKRAVERSGEMILQWVTAMRHLR